MPMLPCSSRKCCSTREIAAVSRDVARQVVRRQCVCADKRRERCGAAGSSARDAPCLLEEEGRGGRPTQTNCWQAGAALLPGQQLAALFDFGCHAHMTRLSAQNNAISAMCTQQSSHCSKQLGTPEQVSSGAIRDVVVAANGFDNRRLSCLRLIARERKKVHARGAAAFSQILPRGSEWRTSFSLEEESSRHETATLPEQCDHARSIARVGTIAHFRQCRVFAKFENYLATARSGNSVTAPGMIYSPRKTLFAADIYLQSQRPSDKRCGSSRSWLGSSKTYVDLYLLLSERC